MSQQYPSVPPAPKRRKSRGKLALLIGAPLLLLASCGTGVAMGGGSQPAAEPGPAVTVTAEPVEVPVPGPTVTREVEVEKVVEVERTPAECIRALDLASEVILVLSDMPALVVDAANAGTSQDATALQEVSDGLDQITEEMDDRQAEVASTTAACRAAE